MHPSGHNSRYPRGFLVEICGTGGYTSFPRDIHVEISTWISHIVFSWNTCGYLDMKFTWIPPCVIHVSYSPSIYVLHVENAYLPSVFIRMASPGASHDILSWILITLCVHACVCGARDKPVFRLGREPVILPLHD